MSLALYGRGGLRFWAADEIATRDAAILILEQSLRSTMERQNSAWTFHRVEGPCLTPVAYINASYDNSDVFMVENNPLALRPETTSSSYLMAEHLLASGLAKSPVCVWQAGKSFRVESNDGASASKLRFNEFWQCEFQLIFRSDTKAPVYDAALASAASAISRITGCKHRIVQSDRLPTYATQTMDVEVPYLGKWKEMASVSRRTDYTDLSKTVVEVAVGLDRLVCAEAQISKGESDGQQPHHA